jgi:starch-binding outer membrane protein, SusD/RagB family
MKKRITDILAIFIFSGFIIGLGSCEKFFDPELGLVIDETDFFRDFEEYRAAEMGLYALQQELVEQIVVLGELRADLLEVTELADRDLIEVYNFDFSPTNKYASPVNFYKLIAACNKLMLKVEQSYPNVLDKETNITIYDRLYGEILCMRAWAYFNAVRIYGKVPYIHPSITDINQIKNYVNSSATFVDSIFIRYAPDGFSNDTIRDTTIVLEKRYLNLEAVVDTFTYELENKIKAVGVIHNQDFNDVTWDVTVWKEPARKALLGQMYLHVGNYIKAKEHFDHIIYNYESETNNIKYGLDNKFSNNRWRDILTQIDPYEHIYTLWFNKANQQTHELQVLFSNEMPNLYQLKPTRMAIQYWEHMWNGMAITYNNSNPAKTVLALNSAGEPRRGVPGDFYRGYGVSYAYFKDGRMLTNSEVQRMLINKADGDFRLVQNLMDDIDTVVYKYSVGKTSYDHDANFTVFRAAAIHFYYAEIYNRGIYLEQGVGVPQLLKSLRFINDGSYNNDVRQLGIRGRVGFANGDEALRVGNVVYFHDPVTNEVIGYKSIPNTIQQQEYLEELFLQEKAREMAYEGERFYDLVRIAKRRNQPEFLAEIVSSKFTGARKESIKAYLMNEENWYVPLFEIE